MSAAMRETGGSTRERVVRPILRHGPSTAQELTEHSNLTLAAIRRRLSALLEEGTLGSREQRVYGAHGWGRPSRVLFLTGTGRSEFHQACDGLAIVVIRRSVKAVGPQAMVDLASEHVGGIESRFNELYKARSECIPIELLTEALGATYAPSVKLVHSGDQLYQHYCPVAYVAAEFPQFYEVEIQLFSRLLGGHVQQFATIAHGDGACTTHVSNSVIPNKIRK